MKDLRPEDRLIVALDVPTGDEALSLVERLPNVTFFKVGLQLFLSGDLPRVLKQLHEKQVFVDLKVPGDISNTIQSVIELCLVFRVRFLTLSTSVPTSTIQAAVSARGTSEDPKLLMVPFLSSLDKNDLAGFDPEFAKHGSLQAYIHTRAEFALRAGCDGLIASGQEIGPLRQAYPDTLLVSPGIRPAGSSSDDHKRFTTPSQAIQLGADYLVVGRPIRTAPDPRDAAQRIIDEIGDALAAHDGGVPSSPIAMANWKESPQFS